MLTVKVHGQQIVIDQKAIEALSFNEGDSFSIERNGNSIVLENISSKKNVKKVNLFKAYFGIGKDNSEFKTIQDVDNDINKLRNDHD